MNKVGPSLVTSYTFKSGKEYIVKIKVTAFKGCQRNLELTITDKYTAENWQSFYDAACLFFIIFLSYLICYFKVILRNLESLFVCTRTLILMQLPDLLFISNYVFLNF